MKVIFVGDRPSNRMKPGAKPFEGAACEKRLKEWIKKLGVKNYEIYNQISIEVHSPIFVTYYDAVEGRDKLISTRVKYIALGNNASKALKYVPHFKLPHPSGQNRQMNDVAYIESCLEKAKLYLNETEY